MRIIFLAVNVLGQPFVAEIDNFVARLVHDGDCEVRTQEVFVFKLHRVPEQGLLKHQRQFPGNLLVVGAGGLVVGVGAHATGVEDEVLLGESALFDLLYDGVEVVGVLVFQADYERV